MRRATVLRGARAKSAPTQGLCTRAPKNQCIYSRMRVTMQARQPQGRYTFSACAQKEMFSVTEYRVSEHGTQLRAHERHVHYH